MIASILLSFLCGFFVFLAIRACAYFVRTGDSDHLYAVFFSIVGAFIVAWIGGF